MNRKSLILFARRAILVLVGHFDAGKILLDRGGSVYDDPPSRGGRLWKTVEMIQRWR